MTRRRFELNDDEWLVTKPLLPNKPRGLPRVDDPRVINGILWRFRTGSPWADIPEPYGPHTTCYNRFATLPAYDHRLRYLPERYPAHSGGG